VRHPHPDFAQMGAPYRRSGGRTKAGAVGVMRKSGRGWSWAVGFALAAVATASAAAEAYKPELNLRADCGAAGDGKADDSLALRPGLPRLQGALDAGRPTVLRIPAGIYRITGVNGAMPMLERRGGTILGEGPHASYILLDPSYAGDL